MGWVSTGPSMQLWVVAVALARSGTSAAARTSGSSAGSVHKLWRRAAPRPAEAPTCSVWPLIWAAEVTSRPAIVALSVGRNAAGGWPCCAAAAKLLLVLSASSLTGDNLLSLSTTTRSSPVPTLCLPAGCGGPQLLLFARDGAVQSALTHVCRLSSVGGVAALLTVEWRRAIGLGLSGVGPGLFYMTGSCKGALRLHRKQGEPCQAWPDASDGGGSDGRAIVAAWTTQGEHDGGGGA